ncbi:MAG: hypothetical protein ABJQ98_10720 [Alloalcanivorax venustensis]|uniref:hypothetical protein n=1 Tax=Alloalcanivorax venustensis TaxID=172371 RepID=UPI00329943D2
MKQKQGIQRGYPDPQLYMPAMPPLGLLNAFERKVQKWWRERAERRQAAALRRSRPSGQH